MKRTVLVCGGGNGAHLLVGLTAADPNIESRGLTLYQNEAEIWSKALENEPLTRIITTDSGKDEEIQSKPKIISKNPADVVPGADVILIAVPAFSHESYLKAIEPFINGPTVLVGIPGQPGFEFQSRSILKNKLPLLTILSAKTFPWACRIVEYGKKVRVLGQKKSVDIATICNNAQGQTDPLQVLQSVVGPEPVFTPAKHFLELSFNFALMHPGLMYGRWKEWDGSPLAKKPLFYQGADDYQAKCINDLSDETLDVAKEFMKRKSGIDLTGCISKFQWLLQAYGSDIGDPSCLKTALVTNKAYDGLTHPMKEVEGGFAPDFSNRYLAEDIPFGLAVFKGLAQLVGKDTPRTDEIMTWAQEKLGKEFIVGTELKGKNLSETRAPQTYGITSLDDLDSFILG